MGLLLDTRYGAIDVTIQDGRTAYVRVGTGDRDDSTGSDARLELPRGAAAYGYAHFKLGDDGWEPHRGYARLYRAGGGELTPTMQAHAWDAIAQALAANVDVDALEDAQYARNRADADARRAQAKALTRMVDQLNRQASELEQDRGARVVYVNQRLRSGTSQDAAAVRTSAGELLFVDEPRASESLNENGLRRYLGEPAEWTERS